MFLGFTFSLLLIASEIACYFITKKKRLNAIPWVILACVVGPFAIPILLLQKEKQATLYESKESSYEAYLVEERHFKVLHAKMVTIGVRLFGALLILFGVLGLANLLLENSSEPGLVSVGIIGLVLCITLGGLTFFAKPVSIIDKSI